MTKINKKQFIWDFMQKNIMPDCYNSLKFNNYSHNINSVNGNNAPVNIIGLFPTYITPSIFDENKKAFYKIKQSKLDGAGILIDMVYNDMDSYMNKNFKSNFRGRIKKCISRLETCFNIHYEYNYGEITHEKCGFLLTELKAMLEKRFEEKETSNYFLNNWNNNTKNTFNLINENKASLFVIYSNSTPISICLNYHKFNNLFFYYQASYDLSYSKFGLGHINVYKFVEWSLKHHYKFIDFGNGILHYKKQWCNTFYGFEYHIIFDKRNLKASMVALVETCKITCKNLAKNLNMDLVYHKMKQIMLKNKNTQQTVLPSYKTTHLKQAKFNSDILNDYSITDIAHINTNLKRTIFDFLFLNKEHINNVSIYKANKTNEYLVFGLENAAEINLTA
tara:strand:- start:2389 stop:3564 length:1176 start_codon:yes stop_codon:yes gene_type:complete